MLFSGNGPWWILFNVAVFQGPLALGLRCSELIVNVIGNALVEHKDLSQRQTR